MVCVPGISRIARPNPMLLQKAAAVSGKSAAQIVREALAVELEKDDYKGD